MDRIKELLSRIETLSDEELGELRDLVVAHLQDIEVQDGKFASDVPLADLEVLASAGDAWRAESKRRLDQLPQGRHALMASLKHAPRTPAVPAGRGVDSSRHSIATAVTAAGVPISTSADLVAEICAAINRGAAPNASDGRVHLATIHASGGDRDVLRRDDAIHNAKAITAAAVEHEVLIRDALAKAARGDVTALTAAGGLGAPEQTDYAMPGFGSAERPVKGALPTFVTSRGGVRYMRPPTLAGVGNGGGLGIWTVADDVAAVTDATVRKPSMRALPGAEIIVDVQAITNILTFGNLMARVYPEFVASVMELATIAQARLAEQQLLTQLGALSTKVTSQTDEDTGLGATRVLLPLIDRAAVGMRNRLRLPANAPLQLILPDWARGILRSDLALQEPGDATLGVTDAELTQYLATRNMATTWAMDGEAGQAFDVQADGPVEAWPTEIVSYLFPAGAFQFLDGGTLDLGLVRDSALNAKNDHMLFMETFEALIYRGGEAFRITTPVTPNGIARAAAIAS